MVDNNWASKGSISNDIEILSDLITRNLSDYFDDSGSLRKAMIQCEYELNNDLWGYEDCEMIFNITPKLGTSKPAKIRDLKAQINISNIRGKVSKLGKVEDPLEAYECELIFSGLNMENKMEKVFNSWHLDRNIPSKSPKCIHPIYHLHYGGNTMTKSSFEFGNGMVLESPRIQHPPLDAVLLVDFILRNFYDKTTDPISETINSSEYKEIVKNSQFRLWRPYYLAKASPWIENNLQISWSANEVLPWVEYWFK